VRPQPELIVASRIESGSDPRVFTGAEIDAVRQDDVPESTDPDVVTQRHRFDEQPEPRGKDSAAGTEHSLPEVEQVLQHVLVEQLVAHLFVDDDVDRLRWGELPTVRTNE